jgi:HEPN domain-containing protein
MAAQADLARLLLGLAHDDESAAKAMLGVEDVVDAIVCFHAQQAVEKALKAALAARGVDFPFTHDLAALVELSANEGLALPPELDDVDRLTPYGARIRYGGDDPGTVAPDKAVQWADVAVAWATKAVRDTA